MEFSPRLGVYGRCSPHGEVGVHPIAGGLAAAYIAFNEKANVKKKEVESPNRLSVQMLRKKSMQEHNWYNYTVA